jgi:uncharacterized protein involved in response to NO
MEPAMNMHPDASAIRRVALVSILTDEGLRLFFPLAALHAAAWPLLWVFVHGFDLPFATSVPPHLWHAHEMLVGAFGAALIGFITTALPEWTDTRRLRGRALLALAGLWLVGRLVGLLGIDALGLPGPLADCLWLAALVAYAARLSIAKRTTRLLPFVGWLAAFLAAEAATRHAFITGDVAAAQTWLHVTGLVFLGLLGLALARITVPITNLVLDPTEETSPFRPHPGRRNLAPGLVAVLIAGLLGGLSEPALGFLAIAAGAAFLDRAGEGFVGREALRAEILALAGSSALSGLGLLVYGAALLGAPFPISSGLHLAFMGGLGLGVLAVFALAGLLHCGRPLGLSNWAIAAFWLLIGAVALRVLPDLGLTPHPPGPPHALSAVLFAGAFAAWLARYWPLFTDPRTLDAHTC